VIKLRWLRSDEIEKIRDLDRSETVRVGCRQEDSTLIAMDFNWDDEGWVDGEGEHSYGQMIRFAQKHVANGATAIGAFDADRLVGISIYRPHLTDTMGQLALLHVSNGYRRQGIASRLFDEVLTLARADGTDCLYVSATPTGSAVGFYRSKGFQPTATPDSQLLEAEPEDIHMILRL